MADQDDYHYQSIPLPVKKVLGDQSYDPTQIATEASASVPGPAVDPTDSPFGPTVSQPFGGGPQPVSPGGTCADDFLAKDINAATINFPCTDPTSTIQVSGASFDDGSGNTATIGYNGIVEVVNGGKTCTIDVSVLPDGAVAQFRSFEICAGQTIWVLSTAPV